jgi:hypothetical protein
LHVVQELLEEQLIPLMVAAMVAAVLVVAAVHKVDFAAPLNMVQELVVLLNGSVVAQIQVPIQLAVLQS